MQKPGFVIRLGNAQAKSDLFFPNDALIERTGTIVLRVAVTLSPNELPQSQLTCPVRLIQARCL